MIITIIRKLTPLEKGHSSFEVYYRLSTPSLRSALRMELPTTYTSGRHFFLISLLSLYLSTKPKPAWNTAQSASNGGGTLIAFGLGLRAFRLFANLAFSVYHSCRRSSATCPRIR
jgi:hypothetical protein